MHRSHLQGVGPISFEGVEQLKQSSVLQITFHLIRPSIEMNETSTMQPPEKLVEVTGLTKKFGEHTAVNNLSFTVNRGDIYGFLGQNGAGKSTTIRMLLSLIRPTDGQISMMGHSLTTHRNAILRQVGAVIEKPDLYKYLSAYDNLSIFARLSGVRADRRLLMDQLDQVGLADRAGDKVKTYSQGMKQRLGIAVALVHEPALILLDEPTNGLDPQGIADMRQLILHLARERGKTVVISSHLLYEIEQLATRMIIIHKGRKMVEGTVAGLLDPSQTLVKLEVADTQAALEILRQSPWSQQLHKQPSLQLVMNRAEVPGLIAFCVSAQIELLSVNTSHTLENYFLSLTTPSEHAHAAAN